MSLVGGSLGLVVTIKLNGFIEMAKTYCTETMDPSISVTVVTKHEHLSCWGHKLTGFKRLRSTAVDVDCTSKDSFNSIERVAIVVLPIGSGTTNT